MNLIQKLEARYGRYAIPNLMLWAVICYVLGFILEFFAPGVYAGYLSLNMDAIFHGQVWRLFTYILCSPASSPIYAALLCFIFYNIGRGLEMMWGSFYFNLYVFIGLFANVLAALILVLRSLVSMFGDIRTSLTSITLCFFLASFSLRDCS